MKGHRPEVLEQITRNIQEALTRGQAGYLGDRTPEQAAADAIRHAELMGYRVVNSRLREGGKLYVQVESLTPRFPEITVGMTGRQGGKAHAIEQAVARAEAEGLRVVRVGPETPRPGARPYLPDHDDNGGNGVPSVYDEKGPVTSEQWERLLAERGGGPRVVINVDPHRANRLADQVAEASGRLKAAEGAKYNGAATYDDGAAYGSGPSLLERLLAGARAILARLGR